jgi:DNA-binding GntR family transcriptional regulator
VDAEVDRAVDPRLLLRSLEEECCAVPADLAGRLGVDEGHVHAGLDGLQRSGFVRRDPDGAYRLPPESAGELRELYVVAILLEGVALRGAARFDDARIEELRAANARLRAATDTEAAVAADDDFHRTLVEASANARLRATHAQCKAALLRYEQHYFHDAARAERSACQHDVVIAALEAGDNNGAAAAVRANFEDSMPDIEQDLGG